MTAEQNNLIFLLIIYFIAIVGYIYFIYHLFNSGKIYEFKVLLFKYEFPFIILCGICVVMYFFIVTLISLIKSEEFNNKEACANLTKNQRIVVKTMAAIPRNSSNIRDQINNGVNYHDMQTRDIVLNDETGAWCSTLAPDVKANVISAIENQLDTEVEIFNGGAIMDRHEKQSNDEGISYNGTDAYDSEYAQV
jgi:uncharacterized membrane protein